jgi:serine/threonine protein kinase
MKKRTKLSEYLIQKKLYKAFPTYIPKPISYVNGILTSKNCGISLKKWFRYNRYNDVIVFQIIKNVQLIMKKINKKFPKFRHMDLHLDNILINNGKILITDFGMSKFTTGRIGYDIHFFLNSIRHQLLKNPNRTPRVLKYLNRIMNNGMKGYSGKFVKSFRLKQGVSFKINESAANIAKRLLKLK